MKILKIFSIVRRRIDTFFSAWKLRIETMTPMYWLFPYTVWLLSVSASLIGAAP